MGIPDPSSTLFQRASQQVDAVVHKNFHQYTHEKPLRASQVPTLEVQPDQISGSSTTSAITPPQVLLNGYDMQEISSHITLLAGHLPAPDRQSIEALVTQQTLDKMGLHIGSIINTKFQQNLVGGNNLVVQVRIVGVIALRFPKETLWYHDGFDNADTFQPQPYGGSLLYPLMTSNTTLLSFFDTIHPNNISNGFFFFWVYPLDVAQLNSSSLDTLTNQNNALGIDLSTSIVQQSSAGRQILEWVLTFGPLRSALPTYSGHILLVEWVSTALLIMTLGLVLFFVSMMSEILIDRQGTVIATLRSRGAQQKQVFGIFATQGLLSALIALIVGSFLAIAVTHGIVSIVLPLRAQEALNTIESNPLATVMSTGWFALIAVAGSVLTMLLAIRRAAHINIVTLRRETARSTKQSLWQRLYLDILIPIIVLIGYSVYSLTLSLPDSGDNNAKPEGTAAFALLAVLLMLIAVIIFFQRVFPFMLRMCTIFTIRGRGASGALALAQIERSPRAASRMISLLALAMALATFTLIFTSSQQQRITDNIDYLAGADFSGEVPTIANQLPAQQNAQYQRIPGVTSASMGYKTVLVQDMVGGIGVHLIAVDAQNFAQSAIWHESDSSQPLSSLMGQLISHRADASKQHVVSAIVDNQMAQLFRLHAGSSFVLTLPASNQSLSFQVVATVTHIPGVYNESPGNPGIVVDYQGYEAAYTKMTQKPLPPNYIWLHTQSDEKSLAQVRQALTAKPLQLGSLQDRRAMLQSTQSNLLLIDLQNMLDIGAATSLLLALLGMLIATWSDTANRLTHFAVLRALGMASRQIAAVFLWEQGIIYISAMLLGMLLGSMLTTLIKPLLIITSNISPFVNTNALNTPPIQIVVSIPQLLLMASFVAGICAVSLGIMVAHVSRPSTAQTLRLNED